MSSSKSDRDRVTRVGEDRALPALTEVEFKLFRDHLYRHSGIALNPSKKILVQNRLRGRLAALGLHAWSDYYAHLAGHGSEVPRFLDLLTTHETFFMREVSHWAFLRDDLLPQIISRRQDQRREFALWSAAASTGEELYSAAIVLLESLPTPSAWNLRLVGTDVSGSVIERAREGVYNKYALRELDRSLRKKYFTPARDEYGQPAWRISPYLRERCRFDVHNLQQPFSQRDFDLVLCRNVFIYFDQRAKQHALQLLLPTLAPGGHLFFSYTDAPIPETPALHRVRPSVYQKICA